MYKATNQKGPTVPVITFNDEVSRFRYASEHFPKAERSTPRVGSYGVPANISGSHNGSSEEIWLTLV